MPINYPNLIAAIENSTGTATRKRKRGTMSVEGRARVAAAQKKRWAQWKRDRSLLGSNSE